VYQAQRQQARKAVECNPKGEAERKQQHPTRVVPKVKMEEDDEELPQSKIACKAKKLSSGD